MGIGEGRSSVIKHFSVIDKALSSLSSHCRKKGEKGVATNQGRAQGQEHLHKGLQHHWPSGISGQGSALSGLLISTRHESHLFSSSKSLEPSASLCGSPETIDTTQA